MPLLKHATGIEHKFVRRLTSVPDVHLVPNTKHWFPIKSSSDYANCTLDGWIRHDCLQRHLLQHGEGPHDISAPDDLPDYGVLYHDDSGSCVDDDAQNGEQLRSLDAAGDRPNDGTVPHAPHDIRGRSASSGLLPGTPVGSNGSMPPLQPHGSEPGQAPAAPRDIAVKNNPFETLADDTTRTFSSAGPADTRNKDNPEPSVGPTDAGGGPVSPTSVGPTDAGGAPIEPTSADPIDTGAEFTIDPTDGIVRWWNRPPAPLAPGEKPPRKITGTNKPPQVSTPDWRIMKIWEKLCAINDRRRWLKVPLWPKLYSEKELEEMGLAAHDDDSGLGRELSSASQSFSIPCTIQFQNGQYVLNTTAQSVPLPTTYKPEAQSVTWPQFLSSDFGPPPWGQF